MFRKYIRLAKPRITLLVVVTTYLGYYLGLRYTGLMMIEFNSIVNFFHLVLSALNPINSLFFTGSISFK